MDAELWLAQLKDNGYRLTEARKAVVETVAGTRHALSPLEVFDRARATSPGLGLVTVYRTLEKLEELGLIQRVHQTHGCQAFIARGNGHEHLLLCTRCGTATFFTGDKLDPLIASISRQTGYKVQDHWLQLFGLCKNCLKAGKK
jgi:Fur family transcriptional regulator, ferric uptake regulator